MQCFLVVYREYPFHNMICLRLKTHLKARVYTTKNRSWDISRYTKRKHCITSINKNCERFEPRSHFKSRLSLIAGNVRSLALAAFTNSYQQPTVTSAVQTTYCRDQAKLTTRERLEN